VCVGCWVSVLLQLANDGRFLLVVGPAQLKAAMAVLQPQGAVVIGEVGEPSGLSGGADVLLRTPFGTDRCLPAGQR